MKLTNKQKEYIHKEYKNKTSSELTELLNQRFNSNFKISTIINYKKRMRLRSGVNTQFQKNMIPHNYKPIGSEFISKDGYTYIKVSDPNKWVHKQVYIYECHFGKIPKDHSVIFGDGNKQNFNIDNLILANNNDKLTAKNNHLIFKNSEFTKTGVLIAKLINKTSKIKRNKEIINEVDKDD